VRRPAVAAPLRQTHSSLSPSFDRKKLYLALAAACALLKHAADALVLAVVPGSVAICVQAASAHVQLDAAAAAALELVSGPGSLIRLFKPATAGGKRLLRATLLQPLRSLPTLGARLDCLAEILSSETLFRNLGALLRKLGALGRLGRFCCAPPRRAGGEAAAAASAVAALLDLRNALHVLPQLAEALGGCSCALLMGIREAAASPELASVAALVTETVDESDDVALGRGCNPLARLVKSLFAVRPERCAFLDVSRHAFCEAAEAVSGLVEEYNAAGGLALSATFAARRGFFLKCSAAEWERAPAAARAPFTQAARRGKAMQLSTAALNALNTRLLDAAADSMLLSQAVLDGAMAHVRERLPLLGALAEAAALLDMQHCFAVAVASAHPQQWVRPAFTADGPLAVKAGRHPVLERLPRAAAAAGVVPNHFFLSDAASLLVIAGANSSGKTTYLKTCAVLAVLAHAGCFVPAAFASFRLLDRLLCVGLTQADEQDEGASTFAVECRELAHALASATPSSLVLMDELGRATSSADGYALCRAACERLLSLGALTLCASHLQQLRELAAAYPNCKTARLEAVAEAGAGGRARLRFLYSLSTRPGEAGPPGAEHYGLTLAADAGFDPPLMADAEAIMRRLEARAAAVPIAPRGEAHGHYALAQRLAMLQASGMGEAALRAALRDLQAGMAAGGA